MSKCTYDKGWAGKCKHEAGEDSAFCPLHEEKRCSSCGKQATRDCDYCGQFVCGAPLCPDCIHDTSTRYGGHKPRTKD